MAVQKGLQFEESLIAIISEIMGNSAVKRVDKSQDLYCGTDFLLFGIRCDVTLNVHHKTHLSSKKILFSDSDIGDIYVGIRTGNGVHNFIEPVLVIGFDVIQSLGLTEKWLDNHSKMFIDILDAAQDFYLDEVDYD